MTPLASAMIMPKKPYRPFQISCGLREGFELSSPEHRSSEARDVIQAWIERRLKEGKRACAGALIEAQFIYPWTASGEADSRFEPAFQYAGIIQDDATDEEALETVTDLARTLAHTFAQKRVHMVIGTEYYLIDKI